jgi:heat shock protein HtpX
MFIINPLHGRKMDNLFATHPATENRVARLRAMSGGTAQPMPRRVERPSMMPRTGRGRDSSGPWA